VHADPPLRVHRALVIAAAATAVGAASHLLSGGSLSAVGSVCALPVLVALAWPLTDRERGWLPILGVQLAGQQAAHVLFGLGSGDHASAAALSTDAWFCAHVLAAVVVTAWLRHGEQRTWAAARRAAGVLSRYWRHVLALVELPSPCYPGVPAPLDRPPTPSSHPLRHSLVRRGPPLPA
jgi:hypothetical protein